MTRHRLATAVTVAIGLALFGVTWGFLFPKKRYGLRWKLHPGQVLRYQNGMSSSSTAGASRQAWVNVVNVRSVDADGAMSFSHVTESMTSRKSGLQGDLDYSSSRGDPLPNDPEVRVMACLVGLPLQVRMNPLGELLDVQGFEEQERARLQAVEKMNFMGWLTAVPLRSNPLTDMEFPARPLAIGESWSQQTRTSSDTFGTVDHRTTYTLQSVAQDVAEIGVATEQLRSQPGVLQRLAGDLKTPDPVIRQEHRIRFSLKRGLLLSERSFFRTDSTTSNGKPFFFEATTERTLGD